MIYAGRTLDLTPLNLPLAGIAARLAAGTPARVVLEPGDATRYEFLLVPMDDQTLGGGYSPGCIAHVSQNNPTRGDFLAINPDYGVGPYTFETYRNEHSRNVMAEFWVGLLAALRAARATPEPDFETLRRQVEAMGPSHDCRTVWVGGAAAPVPA